MTTVSIDRETSDYWELIKKANSKAKLTLITLLSTSLTDADIAVKVETKPLKARRPDALSDEEMESLMQGAPVPLNEDKATDLKDIVEANSGKLVKGMEKWL